MQVDQRHVHALIFEDFHGLQALLHHDAAGEDHRVLAVPQHVAFAHLKGHLRTHRGRQARGTDVHRSIDLRGRKDRLAAFVGVAGHKHGHARQHPHQGDVLHGLMAAAILAQGHACVGEAELHVEVRVAYAVADLVIAAARKHREGGAEGNQPHGAHAGGHVHHVRLGNAAIIEPLGILRGKLVGHRGLGQVGVQHHNLVIGGGQLRQRLAIGDTDRFLLAHLFSPPDPSAPGRIVQRWAPCRASPPGLP